MRNKTFIDFCSGIGGGRIALENLGMNCLGFSEIDKDAEIVFKILPFKINPADLINKDKKCKKQ